MKPTFKHCVKTFKGINRKEGLVYCSYNDGDLIIAKRLPKRKPTSQNHQMGNILANLHELYETISPEYKQDLNTYCLLLQVKVPDKRKVPLRAWGLFVKMMWALKRMYSEIDLCEINREDILKNEYPISTVGEAMDIGILFHIEEANILLNNL